MESIFFVVEYYIAVKNKYVCECGTSWVRWILLLSTKAEVIGLSIFSTLNPNYKPVTGLVNYHFLVREYFDKHFNISSRSYCLRCVLVEYSEKAVLMVNGWKHNESIGICWNMYRWPPRRACLSLFQKSVSLVSGLTCNHSFFSFLFLHHPVLVIVKIVNIELIDELQNNIYSWIIFG